MARKTKTHPLIKSVTFTPTGDTAKELDRIRNAKGTRLVDGSRTMGAPLYTYSSEEVIEFRDTDHTPHNKRPSEVDSTLVVQFRHSKVGKWLHVVAEETTTTKSYGDKSDRTQSRTISFTMPQAMFDALVEHTKRKGD